MGQGEAWQTQATYTEYIPEDILQAAEIYDRPFAMEQLRYELYELENDVAVVRGELQGMRKKWDDIKRSLRFSLIMLVVFFLLYRLMVVLQREQIMMYEMLPTGANEALLLMMAGAVLLDIFSTLFYAIDWIFFTRSIYKLYEFFCNYDSEASRWWCGWTKKKNLSTEIEQNEMRLMGMEERMRRLKQVRTMYRERNQENWKEQDLPERIMMERALSEEK